MGNQHSLNALLKAAKESITSSPDAKTPHVQPDSKRRLDIATEIVTTEVSYVQALEVVVNLYIGPLREQKIITEKESNQLFSNIELIYQFHKTFLADLQSRLDSYHNSSNNNNNNNNNNNSHNSSSNNIKNLGSLLRSSLCSFTPPPPPPPPPSKPPPLPSLPSPNPSTLSSRSPSFNASSSALITSPRSSAQLVLGDLFVKMGDFMKVYVQYVNNFNDSVATVVECKKKKKFQDFHSDRRAQPASESRTIDDLLIQPVQRIPRYLLLLTDLKKHTEQQHADYAHLEKAIEVIGRVLDCIQAENKKMENVGKILEIAESLSGYSGEHLLEPHRSFVRSGLFNLRMLSTKKEQLSDVHVFLFNDIFVLAKPPLFGKSKYISTVNLMNLTFPQDNDVNQFSVKDGDTTFTFRGNPEEIEVWRNDFLRLQTSLVDTVRKNRIYAFVKGGDPLANQKKSKKSLFQFVA